MKAWTRPLNLLVALLVPSVLLIATASAPAVEPAREFLKALRDHKYFDEALEYLDQIESNPAVPIELKETLLFEKGITLVAASREQRDPGLREQTLNAAQQLLNQFVGQRPDHPQANSARSQLGNLIVERARTKVADATKTTNVEQKKQLFAAAKTLYDEAFEVFQALQTSVKAQLEPIPKVLDKRDKQQAKMAELRLQLRADFLQTLLLAAAIREESADAVPAQDPMHAELLTDAAGQYADIYTKYRSRLAGLYARMYQGRCNQKLGKFRDALGYYSELLDQPDEPEAFRRLKTLTMKLAMECWLDPSQKKFKEAINRGMSWIAKSRPTEDREPDWLYLRFMLAKAYQMQGVDARKREEPTTENRARSNARKLAQFVSKFKSDYQKQAQQLVADLGGPDRTGEKVDPKTFAEAMNAGKEALDSIHPATLVVTNVPARIAAEKDATVKDELQKQLDKARQTLTTAQDDAMRHFRHAMQLADAETPAAEIAVVRYFLCYLYYIQQDFLHAGLIGEFISYRYPSSAGARPSAQIALVSYLALFDENKSDDKSFEIDRKSTRLNSSH
jgi:tetratricopeptide (TPR) repeat protein